MSSEFEQGTELINWLYGQEPSNNVPRQIYGVTLVDVKTDSDRKRLMTTPTTQERFTGRYGVLNSDTWSMVQEKIEQLQYTLHHKDSNRGGDRYEEYRSDRDGGSVIQLFFNESEPNPHTVGLLRY
jgi:hypothetical protein